MGGTYGGGLLVRVNPAGDDREEWFVDDPAVTLRDAVEVPGGVIAVGAHGPDCLVAFFEDGGGIGWQSRTSRQGCAPCWGAVSVTPTDEGVIIGGSPNNLIWSMSLRGETLWMWAEPGNGIVPWTVEGDAAYSARWITANPRDPPVHEVVRLSLAERRVESRRETGLDLPCADPVYLHSTPLQRLDAERFAHGVAIGCPGEADVHLLGLEYDAAGDGVVTGRSSHGGGGPRSEAWLYASQVTADGRTLFVGGADADPRGPFVIALDAQGEELWRRYLGQGATPMAGTLDHNGGLILVGRRDDAPWWNCLDGEGRYAPCEPAGAEL